MSKHYHFGCLILVLFADLIFSVKEKMKQSGESLDSHGTAVMTNIKHSCIKSML